MTMHEDDERQGELLSALMDGELEGAEQERALALLRADPALRRRWARYHAARAALTGGAVHLPSDFAERVSAARAAEPTVLAPRSTRRPQPAWLRPAAGVAIAASVALIAIGGLSLLRGPGDDAGPVTVVERAARSAGGVEHDVGAVAPAALPTTAAQPLAERARARQRLMLYLTSHNDYANAGGMPTVIPYGRLSGLNAGQ